VLSTLATAVVIGFGGYLLLAGQLSLGVVAAFLIYVQQFFRPIQLVSQVYTQLQAALAGAERIYAILDEPEEAPDPAEALVLDHADGRVTFDGVWFGYDPSRPCCATSASTSPRARRWPWSGAPAPARRPSPT